MRIDILSVVPQLLESPFNHSIIKRARAKNIVEIYVHDIREFSASRHKQVDDYQYGGNSGMVLMIQPIYDAILHLKSQREYDSIIYTSPDGELLTQKKSNYLSVQTNIIILCGHYKGIDHRIREHLITEEISIGDYVLSGGELAAAVITDSIVRLLPGAISDETSALSDSFQDDLLAAPVYTRPAEFNGWSVPEILLSGNFKKIEQWQMEQSLIRTAKLRPNLLSDKSADE